MTGAGIGSGAWVVVGTGWSAFCGGGDRRWRRRANAQLTDTQTDQTGLGKRGSNILFGALLAQDGQTCVVKPANQFLTSHSQAGQGQGRCERLAVAGYSMQERR